MRLSAVQNVYDLFCLANISWLSIFSLRRDHINPDGFDRAAIVTRWPPMNIVLYRRLNAAARTAMVPGLARFI